MAYYECFLPVNTKSIQAFAVPSGKNLVQICTKNVRAVSKAALSGLFAMSLHHRGLVMKPEPFDKCDTISAWRLGEKSWDCYCAFSGTWTVTHKKNTIRQT